MPCLLVDVYNAVSNTAFVASKEYQLYPQASLRRPNEDNKVMKIHLVFHRGYAHLSRNQANWMHLFTFFIHNKDRTHCRNFLLLSFTPNSKCDEPNSLENFGFKSGNQKVIAFGCHFLKLSANKRNLNWQSKPQNNKLTNPIHLIDFQLRSLPLSLTQLTE